MMKQKGSGHKLVFYGLAIENLARSHHEKKRSFSAFKLRVGWRTMMRWML